MLSTCTKTKETKMKSKKSIKQKLEVRMPKSPMGTKAFTSIKRSNRQMQKVALKKEI